MEVLKFFASAIGILSGAFFISFSITSILTEITKLYAQIMKNQAFEADFILDAVFLAIGISMFFCSFFWFLTLIF